MCLYTFMYNVFIYIVPEPLKRLDFIRNGQMLLVCNVYIEMHHVRKAVGINGVAAKQQQQLKLCVFV